MRPGHAIIRVSACRVPCFPRSGSMSRGVSTWPGQRSWDQSTTTLDPCRDRDGALLVSRTITSKTDSCLSCGTAGSL